MLNTSTLPDSSSGFFLDGGGVNEEAKAETVGVLLNKQSVRRCVWRMRLLKVSSISDPENYSSSSTYTGRSSTTKGPRYYGSFHFSSVLRGDTQAAETSPMIGRKGFFFLHKEMREKWSEAPVTSISKSWDRQASAGVGQ